ncbi:leucine-rich repeat domain-containing protein [Treponema socranskii]|uniref:leucine-rich repeat domain-containing protein n=1 Tax=Treponema socranskii TaxID=53419 RepID=UPI0023F0B31A|nr:leucine-rich repeat domain-containing protein [Treponema socranskii]
MSGFNSSNKKTRVAALVTAAVLLTGLAISCSNGSDSGGGGGTPPTPPPVQMYKVELDHTIGGNVKVEPVLSENGMVAENTELTFTATPLQGYDLEKWELNDTEVNGTVPTYTLKVTANAQVMVFFKRNGEPPPAMHTVTLTEPEHGSVDTVPVIPPGHHKVPDSSEITFMAVPDAGYAVNKWTISAGSFLLGGTDGSTSATLKITEDVTVTVTFKQVLCKIDFGVDGGNGTLTAKVDGTEISSGDMVEHGKTVVFKATPDSNCAVEQWTNNGTVISGGANTTYNHTVTAAANIKVKFKYTGAALTVDTTALTGTVGRTFRHRFVTGGSGSYTAEAETPDILTLFTADLNSQGEIGMRCEQVGSTRIKITDKVSGQTAFSGLITVQADVNYFAEGGVRYHITDNTAGAEKVSVTAYTGSQTIVEYTVPSLTIPKEVTHGGVTYTVTGVEWVSTWGTTLQSVTVASDNEFLSSQNGVIFNKDKTVLLWYPCGKPATSYTVPSGVIKLEENSFRDIDALTSVTLPNGLKTIASYVFYYCPNLTTLNLPSSLEAIGGISIRGLKVSSMVVPENIKVLNWYVLSNCPELTSVELPSTLTIMDFYVLSSDPKLKTVTCKAANPPAITAGQHVFEDTPIASARLRVPAGSKARYQAAEGWKDFGTIEEF